MSRHNQGISVKLLEDPEDLFQHESDKRDLNKILKHLTEPQRTILVLRQIYGYTLLEISKELKIIPKTVSDFEIRAMNKLKKLYKEGQL